jgi:transcriptional regulator with XRE-family HTH domain
MGSFGRSFSAALTAAGLTHTSAAAQVGLTQTSVSRNAAGGSLPSVRSLSHLLPLLRPGDRQECLRQYLIELTPEAYQAEVTISFAEKKGRKARIDDRLDTLGAALVFLDREATVDKHLSNMLIELARTLSGSNAAQFIPSTLAQIERAEDEKRKARRGASSYKKPTAAGSAGQSPRRGRRSGRAADGLAAG